MQRWGDSQSETQGNSHDTSGRRALSQSIRVAAFLLALMSAVVAPAMAQTAGIVTVEVVNATTGRAVAGTAVVAKKRVGSSFSWAAQVNTDGAGKATFKLAGLGTGTAYAFFANPFNTGWAQSADVAKTGTFRFLVGLLPVQVVAGGTRAPLPNVTVTVKERLPDTSLKWVSQGVTDASGRLTLDPPGLGKGRIYVLEAPGPWDGAMKRSNDISATGAFTFVVGNAPLKVTLMDAISSQPLAPYRVTAYERLSDGSLKWHSARDTDAAGKVVFDLPGLGSGRTYVLSATVFHGLTVTSRDLTAAGDFAFKVGTLKLKLVSGGSNAVLPNARVDAYEELTNGTRTYVAKATSDAGGIVRFDLTGLGQGRRYVMKAVSPWDGTSKWSNGITTTGNVTFVVGNAPLRVTLKNGVSGLALPSQSVVARERLADGTLKWTLERTTDAAGKAIFDLDGLGAGRTYVLTTAPYGLTVTSAALSAPGNFTFNVGTLEVAVVKGGDGSVLPGLPLSVREKMPDGSLVWAAGATTDVGGIVRLDLPGLGQGRTYVLEAKSPVDGSTKRSDEIKQAGRFTFRVGTAPLDVFLSNALSGDPLAGLQITAQERLANGTLQWSTARTTDTSGRVLFDLDGLGNGRTYVLSVKPYNGGTVYSGDLRQPGSFDFRVGSVEVTAVSGADGSLLPNWKVTVREKAADGTLTWVASATTDGAGMIRFDLPGLAQGKIHVLEAKSPLDGSTKRSQDITAIGRYLFRVGGAPTVVTLRNAISGMVLPGIAITVRERTPNGTRWVRQVTTDAHGQILVDLDGVDAGRIYYFSCAPYDTGTVDSADVTGPGPVDFLVGTLEVTLLSGITGLPLEGSEVAAYEVLSTGKRKWMRVGYSDAEGIIRFDLPGLGNGRSYILEGHSPVDDSHKYSDVLTAPGRLTFVVGNEPIQVTLLDGLTGLPLAETDVSAYELLADGDWRWTAWRSTDASGVALFDLDGLGDGRTFFLYADPFSAGGVASPQMTEPGAIEMRIGTIPVTLIDADFEVPIADMDVHVYEVTARGKLRWYSAATTDANGVVRFDFEGVSRTWPDAPVDGRRYVLQLCNPFGVEKTYYSGIIDREGPFEFRITREGEYPVDVTVPSLSVTNPVDGGNVDVTGFTVEGFAADDATLMRVEVAVEDPVAGVTTGRATYDVPTEQWSFSVLPAMITLGQSVAISVEAYDQAGNHTATSVTVQVIVDTAPPAIAITSHQEGDEVEKTGFLLRGTALDDIAVATLVANVDDPVLGRTVSQQPVDVTPGSGQWTFTVLNGQMTQGQDVLVSLEAADAKGNRSTTTIQLKVVAVDFEGTHLINRITFGATPALYTEVATIGADAFLTQQLSPQTIDDAAFNTLLAARPTPATTADLQRYALFHMINSRRQLREVMTQFWDNHFNTDINKTRVVSYELAENIGFRQNALGRFRDLLTISARSPAMLIYLDNTTSQRANPNENYARELMELHTLGVDGGYTQRDVEQVAAAFTGWQTANGQFVFNLADHDTGPKVVLGAALAANRGIEDGDQVLDILAAHPSTARFLCTKLSRLFVSDAPPAALVDRCAQSYLSSGGQIGTTVATILRSPEFGDPLVFRAKVKTPLELVVGMVRNFGATTDMSDLQAIMDDLGMRLFQNPVPTGWSETGDDWTNSNALVQRMRFVNQVAYAAPGGVGTSVQLRPFFTNGGFTTADGIIGFLFQMLFHHDYSDLDRQVALDILTNGGTASFDINAPNADARLRRLAGTVMTYPGYQFQ